MLAWIALIFMLLYSVLIFYYFRSWRSLPSFRGNKRKGIFISVVIPARNEENAISGLLQSLKRQTYPPDLYEILLVDDFSTDGTAAVALQASLPNLIVIQPDADGAVSSKKKAIEAGVKRAMGELIVTTDADCIASPEWLQTIVDFYSETGAAFIAAPVKFSYTDRLFQKFQAIDFLVLQGITAASVAANFHTMCNGANLAYQKKAFNEVNGFEGIDQVATGDDMLLMHKIWKQYPGLVFYLKSQAAIISTSPMPTGRAFYMQRKRWASKTFVYDDYRIILVLAFVYIFNLLFFLLLAAAFANPLYAVYALGFLVAKTVIEWPFVSSVARFYGERRLMKYFFLFQPFHIFYTLVVGLASQFGTYEWKGRTAK